MGQVRCYSHPGEVRWWLVAHCVQTTLYCPSDGLLFPWKEEQLYARSYCPWHPPGDH